MNLVLLGLSYRTAPVEIRERYAVASGALSGLNEKLVRAAGVSEAALLATCNRTELLAVSSEPDAALDRLQVFLHAQLGDGSAGPQHVYELRDEEVVLHVLRIAASLDSMVLGEAQILGQLKVAYRAAVQARSAGPILNRLFQRAFGAAKRVRTETGLGTASVSVARIGVNLAQELFESLEQKRILLLGAGEMAEAALRGLREGGVEDVVVLSRTRDAADRLAQRLAGRPGTLEELGPELARADVVLSSLQTEGPLLRPAELRAALDLRHGQPLLIVDLGLPRNVAPEVNELENVYLYDLDDLEDLAEAGRAERQAAIEPAERILLRERDRFEAWRASLPLVPTIRELLQLAQEVARSEARRVAAQLDVETSDKREALERLAEGIVAKLLHRPLEQLRAESQAGSGLYYAEALRRLFGLGPEEDER